MQKGVQLDGIVTDSQGRSLTEEEFSESFLTFLETNGFLFGGMIQEVDANE